MNSRDSKLRKAQKSKNNSDWTEYRRLKNFVTNLINRAKRTFFNEQLSEEQSKQVLEAHQKGFPHQTIINSIFKDFHS